MYNWVLNEFIKGIIADGIITDKERAVLHKKAEENDIDIDEIDVYVDGLIAQMKNHEETTSAIKKCDPALFLKETTSWRYEPVYYKLKKVYLAEHVATVNDIQITFMAVTDANNKDNYKNWRTFMGIGFLFSVNTECCAPDLCFTSNNEDLLLLDYDAQYNSFQRQNIRNEKANKTWGYKIYEEQLKALCEAENIQVQFHKESNSQGIRLKKTALPHFEYYAQYFYRVMIDPEAYPDAEKHLQDAQIKKDQEIKAAQSPMLGNLTDQQVAGILSRKIGGNRILSPYYMSQYKVLDCVVTDVAGKIVTRKSNKNSYMNYKPNLYLHAIMTEDNEAKFYLCMTTSWRSEIKGTIVLSINLKDHTLFPVTDNESFLSDKSPHKETDNEYYNFFYINRDLLNALLKAKGLTLKIIDDEGKLDEYKIHSVPGNWKKAFKLLSSKDGQKKWEEQVGGFSKYFQTLLSIIESAIGIKKFLLILLAIIILYIIIF